MDYENKYTYWVCKDSPMYVSSTLKSLRDCLNSLEDKKQFNGMNVYRNLQNGMNDYCFSRIIKVDKHNHLSICKDKPFYS
jgi:hypothetical protein